jgi:GntR family transcriptional regulator
MDMKFKEGNVPLYFQFYLMIKNDIMLGEIQPGARIPNIEQLHARYGVSHATVRRALALLEKEGLIVKKRGIGTIVRDEVDLPIWNPTSLRDLSKSALKDVQARPLFCGWIDPPRRVASYYGKQANSYRRGLIFKVQRLWASREVPRHKRVSTAWYPANVVSQVGEKKLRKTTLLQTEIKRGRYRTIRIHQALRPWICDTETAELLEIPDGTPVFHRTWVFYNSRHEVFVISESITTANSLVRMFETKFPAEISN